MQTIRQQMISLLIEKEMDARVLSQTLGIQEKEVYLHLAHIAMSVISRRKKLVIERFCCLDCGYVFKNRKRFSRPGRCPNCKRSHIEMPRYRICDQK